MNKYYCTSFRSPSALANGFTLNFVLDSNETRFLRYAMAFFLFSFLGEPIPNKWFPCRSLHEGGIWFVTCLNPLSLVLLPAFMPAGANPSDVRIRIRGRRNGHPRARCRLCTPGQRLPNSSHRHTLSARSRLCREIYVFNFQLQAVREGKRERGRKRTEKKHIKKPFVLRFAVSEQRRGRNKQTVGSHPRGQDRQRAIARKRKI